MKLISLMYHDIETTRTRLRYAFSIGEFKEHLAAIKNTVGHGPAIPGDSGASGFALTFDDGHVGWLKAAEALNELRWKASFFIVTKGIGRPGALDRSAIRQLAGMGHVIGSHTVDHPALSGKDDAFILDQWTRSKAALEDILGQAVTTGSVPGGFYSPRVARAADAAGLKHLFTSEPVVPTWEVGGCRVLGRFTLLNGMSRGTVARIVGGDRSEHARHYLAWRVKKAVRSFMPRAYLALRDRVNKVRSGRLP